MFISNGLFLTVFIHLMRFLLSYIYMHTYFIFLDAQLYNLLQCVHLHIYTIRSKYNHHTNGCMNENFESKIVLTS